MKISRLTTLALLKSAVLLILLAPSARQTAIAQSPQANSCPNSFEWTRQWGSTGSGPGQFRIPVAIAADTKNDIHVVDRDNQRIQNFNAAGDYLLEYGNQDGRVMINPNGIEVGPIGILCGENFSRRVFYDLRSGPGHKKGYTFGKKNFHISVSESAEIS